MRTLLPGLLLIIGVPVSWFIGRDLFNYFWPAKPEPTEEDEHDPEA